jgi:hypothetical protein
MAVAAAYRHLYGTSYYQVLLDLRETSFKLKDINSSMRYDILCLRHSKLFLVAQSPCV